MDPARARRLSERITQIVAEMLERRIKDPRLGFVTVTDTRVTGDLRDATVFYTVYGSAEEQAATKPALARAAGAVRPGEGGQTGVQATPALRFNQYTRPEGARYFGAAPAEPPQND